MPGPIRTYKIQPFVPECTEVQAHAAPVERMRITFDEQFLFTVGEDGALCIFEVKDREHRATRREKEAILPVSEEIIVTKNEIDELYSNIDNQNTALADLTGTTSNMPQQNKLQSK
jgi:hypothetical protein